MDMAKDRRAVCTAKDKASLERGSVQTQGDRVENMPGWEEVWPGVAGTTSEEEWEGPDILVLLSVE